MAQDTGNREPRSDFGVGLAPGERSPGPYSAGAVPSRGRLHAEPPCPTRSPFQRDRDRILHSTSFRRLTYKTQVFLFHEGDHYRTRLTHSLEVAQIARTIARQLLLDEDLAEALALAHDLGHSPFGHAGERALDRAMKSCGGFDHNAQSLRVVMHLERKYLAFDGLNLTWESLEGLAKHNGPLKGEACRAVLETIRPLETWQSLAPAQWASAEAQVAALSDDIAYLNHDIDDGLRAGLIRVGDLVDVPVAGSAARAAQETKAHEDSRLFYDVTRRMITVMIRDVVDESRRRLERLSPGSPDDIRAAGEAVVAFSAPTWQGLGQLRSFLFERVYRHPRVMNVMAGAETIVGDLFARYLAVPEAMPGTWRSAAAASAEGQRARVIGDFVAGMTDRFAIAEHRRLFDATPELR